MSKTPGRSAALAAAVSALLISSVANASGSGSGAPASAASTAAGQHVNAGLTAREDGRWNEACEKFAAAWALSKEPRIAALLGQAEIQVGKPRNAVAHLSHFLHAAGDASLEDRSSIAELLLEARGKLGALRVRVDEPGAEVLVDDVVVGRGPLVAEVLVEPGQRQVTARKPGLVFVAQAVDVKSGDGLREMQIGSQAAPVAAEARTPGGATERRERWPKWKPWAIGGSAVVAAAGFGVGAGMVVHANDLASDANAMARQAEEEARKELWATPLEAGEPRSVDVCPGSGERQAMCNTYDRLSDRHANAVRWATAGFIVGGVATAATLTMLLWPNADRRRSSTMVLPVLGDGMRGIGVVGSF